MKTAVYPGSFDPVTFGHIDIIDRSSKLFDKVIVAVLNNPSKEYLFSTKDRMDMLRMATEDYPNVEVDCFSGLLVDYMDNRNANTVIRGLRAVSDFEYEFQMALMNRKLNRRIETIFMMTSSRYSYLSSSIVKEVAGLGGCVKDLVPDFVNDRIMKKFGFK
jgi:pantetheine-phosphate adenylyltransferase